MKRTTTIIFAVFLLAASVHAQELPDASWGMEFPDMNMQMPMPFVPPDLNRMPGMGFPDMNAGLPRPGFPDMNMQMPEAKPNMKIDPLLASVIQAYKEGSLLSDVATQYGLAVEGNRIKVTINADKNFNPSAWKIKVEKTELFGNMQMPIPFVPPDLNRQPGMGSQAMSMQQITAYLTPEEIEKIAAVPSVAWISHAFNFEMPKLELPEAMKLSVDLNLLIEQVKAGRSLQEVADEMNISHKDNKVLVGVALRGDGAGCKLPTTLSTAKGAQEQVYLSLDEIEDAAKCPDVLFVFAVTKAPQPSETEKPENLKQGDLTLVYIGAVAAFLIFFVLGIFFARKMKKLW